MRENWLSNRIFKSFDDIVDHCCDAWNKLIDQPWRIMSIGMRESALRFATVLLDAGILPMQEPVTAECHNGKAERISIEKVPSYADRLGAPLEVKGVCALKVDIACGGDSFVIVDAAADGLAIRPEEAHDLAEMDVRIVAAANEQLGFTHPQATSWDRISFCQFAGPLTCEGNELHGPNAVVVRPGKIDHSPEEGNIYRARSIIGSEFVCRIARRATIGGRPPIIPAVSGRAWITGVSQYMLDPADPWPSGYRLSDAWPRIRESI
jgi:proline racemase